MIQIRISIDSWLDRFESLYATTGPTPFKHKFWEFQIIKSNDLLAFDLRLTSRQDHAGLDLWLGLAGYSVNFVFYDHRHWNSQTNTWVDYTQGNINGKL